MHTDPSLDGTVISLDLGYAKTCVVTNNGTPMCTGWVGFQQFTNTPVIPAKPDGKAKLIAAGGNHICVVLETGNVQCWGENKNGQLGNGSTTDSQKFVEVKGLQNSVMAIGAYFDYTCVLTSAGEIFCWGSNSAGQLGDGTTTTNSKPVKVIGITQ